MKQARLPFNDHAKATKPRKVGHKRTSPLCIRFSPSERAYLEKLAGKKPVGTYIRDMVLDDSVKAKRRIIAKQPEETQKLISRVFSAWVNTRFPHNITQLLLATQSSPQMFTSELCMIVLGAGNDVQAIRQTLIEVAKTCRIKDVDLLNTLLGRLKNKNIASRFNQLVLSIHIGAFILSPEVQNLILEVCAEVDAICTMLHKAVDIG